MKKICFLLLFSFLLAFNHFQTVQTQYAVIKSSVKQFKPPHFQPPNPLIAAKLGKDCDAVASKNDKSGLNSWWNDYFASKTSGTAGMKKFDDLKAKATPEQLEKLCYFPDDNHGYLYECSQDELSKCQCMKGRKPEDVVSAAVILDSGTLSCLVEYNRPCYAAQRTKPPNPGDPSKSPIEVPYTCIPDYYCSKETRRCEHCYDPDPKKRKNIKLHPLCPDPAVTDNSGFQESSLSVVFANLVAVMIRILMYRWL